MNASRDHHVALVKFHLQIWNCNAKKSSQTDNHIRLFKHDSVSETESSPTTKVMIQLHAQAVRNIQQDKDRVYERTQANKVSVHSQQIVVFGLAFLWAPLFSLLLIWLWGATL